MVLLFKSHTQPKQFVGVFLIKTNNILSLQKDARMLNFKLNIKYMRVLMSGLIHKYERVIPDTGRIMALVF